MASTTYYADIQKLYVAYFNRPADVAGLNFWEGVVERANGDTSAVSAAFAGSAEYQAAYGGKNAYQVVATVYQNLFGHAPDQAGLDFWAQNLMKGAFTVSEAVTAIAAGAQGSDLTAYNNKVTAAGAFTSALNDIDEILGYDGAEANLRAKAFMAGVTTDASLAAAIEPAALDAAIDVVITPTVPPVASFTLAATAASVDEGKTIYFNLGSTNAVAGSEYSYVISGVDAGDVVGGALTGTVKLDSAGKAVVAITLSADATTEGVENLALTVAGKTATVIVADTSQTPATSVTYALTASANTVDEGGQVTFKLDTTGVAAGTVLSYQLTGIDASRVNGPTAGQVTVDANGQALIVVKTVANALTDGATTMQLSLVNGKAAANVGVNDTSMTPTVFTIDSAKIVSSNNTNGPVVVTVADTGTATVNINSTTAVHANNGIVIQGDADTTVNMGANNTLGSSETVYVTGTGSNTVVFGRQSTDSVILGNGNDTVKVNSLTMAANQVIDFGTGTDTLDVNGVNNFSAGTLSGVENVTMHSSAVFSAAQLTDIESITELGSDGTLTVVQVGAVAGVDLTGKLIGEMKLVVGAGVAVTLGAAELENITAITTNAGAVVTTTVAGAQALLAINANAFYSISDTAENLASAPAAVFGGSGLQQVEQEGAGTLSIAQAVAVHAASPAANFTVSATADELTKALVFDSTFEALASAQATIVINGPVDALQASIISYANLNTEFAITDTAQHVADMIDSGNLNPSMVTGLNLSGTVTADGASQLVSFADDAEVAISGLNIVDDFFSLMGLSTDEKAAAASIRLDADESIDVDMARDLKTALGTKLVGGYNLSDDAASLVANAALAAGANDIEVNGIVGVAVAGQLSKLGNSGSIAYSLQDSPTNLANASAAVLANASEISVQGTVTVAQANAIVGYAVDGFVLVDTAANVLGASAAVIEKATFDDNISITDAFVNVATGTALFALQAGINFNVVDTAAALIAADIDVLDQAGDITVSGVVTVEQAEELMDMDVGVKKFALSDTVANVLDASGAVLGNVTVVSASGTASVADVAALKAITGFDGKFAIVDSADNVAGLIATGATGIAVLNASTAKVVITGDVDVATATLLQSATFTNWNHIFDLTDSFANLNAATVALRNAAANVFVEDSIANVNTNFAWINANADGYVLVDTVANLIAGGNAIVVSGADAGEAIGVATAAQAATLFSLNADIDYDMADTAAALLLAANANGVRNASSVAINGNVTVAQAKSIIALHAVDTYNLSDSAANLAAVSAAATVAGAENVTVTGTVTAAQAGAIVNAFDGDTLTIATITDTVAAIQAASDSTITAAGSLVVTDGTRLHLSAAELAHFGQVGGVLNNVTTTAAGASSTDVHFDVIDTLDNLVAVSGSLAAAGEVTVLAGGEAVDIAVAAGVVAILEAAGVTATGFNVEGTAAALVANADVTEAAASVTVLGTASAADATALLALNTGASFDVSDTVAALTLAANAAAVAAADEVTVTGDATVAKMKAILVLNADADYSIVSFTDTAANLAANAALIDGHTVSVTNAATAAQFNAITAVTNAVMSVTDTAANLVNVDADMLASNAFNVTVSTSATAAQAEVLSNLSFHFMFGTMPVSYTVTDSAANIIAFTGGLSDATAITVTGTATAAQAVELAALGDMDISLSFEVADTAANLLDQDNLDGVSHAESITVIGDIDVATAGLLNWWIGGDIKYTIVDSLDHLIEAAAQLSGGADDDFNLNAVLGNADSVTITGGADIAFVEIDGQFYLSGNIAELKALPASLLEIGYVVEDTVAHIVADFGFAVAGETGYSIVDSGANILAAATSLIGGANEVIVTGAITAANATAIMNINGDSSFNITDTVANLVNVANAAAASQADVVVATGNATAAQGTILAGFGASFVVSDTAANLLAIGNAAALAEATTVAVTGAGTTVAQIDLINDVATVTSYNLTDSAATLVANAALVTGATAVVVTGTANGDQAKAIFAAKPTAVYSIDESNAAKLFTNGVLNASVSAAAAVDGDLVLKVAEALAITGLGDKFDGTFAVVDSAAAVAAAGQTLLDVATGVTVTGTATAAQATAIAALTFGVDEESITVSIVDSATNLLLAANASGIAGQDVTVTGTVTVAQATSIDAANGTGDIVVTRLSDTSTNLQLGSDAVVDGALAIHVTDTQTVAQAEFLAGNVGSADYTFARITDSLTNVLGDLDLALSADVITVTGTATVAQSLAIADNAALTAKLSAHMAIADTVAHILDAYLDQDLRATVTSAPTITVTDDVSAAQAVQLQGFGNVAIGSLDIVDTVSAINGLSAGLINLSDSITAIVDTDLARQQFSDAGMSTSATIVYTNGAAANGAEILTTATPGVYNTAAADILTLKAGDMIDLSAFGLHAEDGNGTFDSGEYMIVRGNVSNGGNTFTQSNTGTSTMVIFDADTTAGVHSSGIILVGQAGTQLTIGGVDAADLSLVFTPPGGI